MTCATAAIFSCACAATSAGLSNVRSLYCRCASFHPLLYDGNGSGGLCLGPFLSPLLECLSRQPSLKRFGCPVKRRQVLHQVGNSCLSFDCFSRIDPYRYQRRRLSFASPFPLVVLGLPRSLESSLLYIRMASSSVPLVFGMFHDSLCHSIKPYLGLNHFLAI